jgi:asparagine synthase (glutamine-hydrolysing)
MCGIAGIFYYQDPEHWVDESLIHRITRVLEHRGPDDEGFLLDKNLALGHRRLSIVDVSSTAHQPMPNEESTHWICYNGEFYNHLDFRPYLESKGHRFRSRSDTETLLHLWEEKGSDCLHEIAGIFSFALWDSIERELILARDPLGVKQLYYYDTGSYVIFASEIKSILACEDVQRSPDPQGINEYLHFHTPLFERTFFRNILQLRPGEFLRFSRQGCRKLTYWELGLEDRSYRNSEEYCNELSHRLEKTVKEQLMSDVPVGAFLSGGIDSSAIAAFAKKAGWELPCFGVHFANQGVIDERPYQQSVADTLGLDLHLITLDGANFPEDLQRLLYFQDQPIIGPAMFPMAEVSKLASQFVKVCLGGQAADEVFGGYARYALMRPFGVVKSFLWDSLFKRNRIGEGKGNVVGGNLKKQLFDWGNIYRLAKSFRYLTDLPLLYFENFAKVPEGIWQSIFQGKDFVSRDYCREIYFDTIEKSPYQDAVTRVMHWDTQAYLPGLFHQDDRMSMANSLESRVPFADPRLVQFAFNIPAELKINRGATKWILREAVSGFIPDQVLNRRKVGFDTPAKSWIKNTHLGFVKDLLLSSQAKSRGFWEIRNLRKWLEDESNPLWFDVIWKAICIEMWANIYIDKR